MEVIHMGLVKKTYIMFRKFLPFFFLETFFVTCKEPTIYWYPPYVCSNIITQCFFYPLVKFEELAATIFSDVPKYGHGGCCITILSLCVSFFLFL